MQNTRLIAGICAGAVALFITGCAVETSPDNPPSTTIIHEDKPNTVVVPVPGPSTHTETKTTTPSAPGAPSTSTTTTTGG